MVPLITRLRDEVASYLYFTVSDVRPLSGEVVNVGEEFDVTFTIRNSYGWTNKGETGHFHFVNARLILEETKFASPSQGSPLEVPIGDSYHHPGLVQHLGYGGFPYEVTVRFTATGSGGPAAPVPGAKDWPEHFVNARVEADFDIATYLHVSQTEPFHLQIEEN